MKFAPTIIIYLSLFAFAFAGHEPELYFQTPEKAAEFYSQFTADSPAQYPAHYESAAVTLTNGHFAVLFVTNPTVASPYTVDGPPINVKSAFLALLVHEPKGWKIEKYPARFNAWGDGLEIKASLVPLTPNTTTLQQQLVVTVNSHEGQKIHKYILLEHGLQELGDPAVQTGSSP